MSELETLVVDALRADVGIASMLAKVDDGVGPVEYTTPAVFVNAAPDDRSPRWEPNGNQLPYLVVTAQRSWTATTPVDGELVVTAVGTGDDPVALQRLVEGILDGAFWHPTTEPDTATRKAGERELAETAENRGYIVRARESTYDLVAFAPAPITPPFLQTLIDWTAATLTGVSVSPPAWTRGTPAVYWRLVAPWGIDRIIQGQHDGGLDQWWVAGARAHVLATGQVERLQIALQLAQAVVAQRRWGDARLDLRQQSIMIDPGADPLRDGQVTARVLFLYHEPAPAAEPLETIIATGDIAMEVT